MPRPTIAGLEKTIIGFRDTLRKTENERDRFNDKARNLLHENTLLGSGASRLKGRIVSLERQVARLEGYVMRVDDMSREPDTIIEPVIQNRHQGPSVLETPEQPFNHWDDGSSKKEDPKWWDE